MRDKATGSTVALLLVKEWLNQFQNTSLRHLLLKHVGPIDCHHDPLRRIKADTRKALVPASSNLFGLADHRHSYVLIVNKGLVSSNTRCY